MSAKQEPNQKFKKEEKPKNKAKNEGATEMAALKPPYPECTFVLGGFLIALP